jgi:uroporphyrinogen III methyltransferase/synthase
MEQSADLTRPLRERGATVVACPAIDIIDPPQPELVVTAIERLASYDWVVLTSTNAVDRFFRHPAFHSDPATVVVDAGVRVAAVGRATADRLAELDLPVDLVPVDYRAEGLADVFVGMGAGEGWRFLIPRALEAREVLRDTLEPLGAVVDVVPVYRTVPATPAPEALERLAAGGFDVVTFTSPSTVRNFLAMLETAGLDPHAALSGVLRASIGPVTTAALVEAGLDAGVEAEPSTVPALVDAIVGWYLRPRVD